MATIASISLNPLLPQLETCFSNIDKIRSISKSNKNGVVKIVATDPLLSKLMHIEKLANPDTDYRANERWRENMKGPAFPYIVFHCLGLLLEKNAHVIKVFSRIDRVLIYKLYTSLSCRLVRTAMSESLISINRLTGTVFSLRICGDAGGILSERFLVQPLPTLDGYVISREMVSPSGCYDVCRKFVEAVQQNDADYIICFNAMKESAYIPPLKTMILDYIFGDGHGDHPSSSLVTPSLPKKIEGPL